MTIDIEKILFVVRSVAGDNTIVVFIFLVAVVSRQ